MTAFINPFARFTEFLNEVIERRDLDQILCSLKYDQDLSDLCLTVVEHYTSRNTLYIILFFVSYLSAFIHTCNSRPECN